jgi:hypothetical protein
MPRKYKKKPKAEVRKTRRRAALANVQKRIAAGTFMEHQLRASHSRKPKPKVPKPPIAKGISLVRALGMDMTGIDFNFDFGA